MSFDNIPDELKALKQWLTYREEPTDNPERTTKRPYQARKRNLILAKTNDSSTWCNFSTAVRRVEEYKDMDGIGFVFTEDDPYIGIDIDDGDPHGIAEKIDEIGTYAEYSPSGTGIHLIGRGKLPLETSGKHPHGIGFFQFKRFFTFTGNLVDGEKREIIDIQPFIDQNWATWFPDKPEPVAPPPVDAMWFAPDEEILRKLRKEKHSAKFEALWRGDTSEYGGDDSAADLALMSKIAFYTQDHDQMSRIFGQSVIGRRDKWLSRPDYREMTITKALTRSDFYTPPLNSEQGITIILTKTPDGEETRTPTFNMTDLGNANRLAYHLGESFRYNPELGTWLEWDGRRWRPDNDGAIMRAAIAVSQSIYQEAAAIPDDEARKKMVGWAAKSEATARLRAMGETAQAFEPLLIRNTDLDASPMLLNCANGTLDLSDGSFRPHERRELLTKLSPVTYDPHATCPTWDAFLNQIFNHDTDLIRFVQRALGYSMTGDTTERALFIMYGSGRNGKSTLVELIARILGDYARSSSSDIIAAKKTTSDIDEDLSQLPGVRFTYAAETGEYSRMNEAKVKHITGGDTVSTRGMWQHKFQFVPQFKLWLSTNHRPNIRGIDHGIWDRIRLIPFTVRIEDHQVDRYLRSKLLRESSGILNWLVDGARMWLDLGGLGTAAAVTASTIEYREAMDTIGAFIDEHLVFDPSARESVGEVYSLYTRWAEDAGEDPATKQQLSNRLADRGIPSERKGKQRITYFIGIRKMTVAEIRESHIDQEREQATIYQLRA